MYARGIDDFSRCRAHDDELGKAALGGWWRSMRQSLDLGDPGRDVSGRFDQDAEEDRDEEGTEEAAIDSSSKRKLDNDGSGGRRKNEEGVRLNDGQCFIS